MAPDAQARENSSPCSLCNDDGWVEKWISHVDENGEWIGDEPVQAECPYLNEPGHAPFNASGLLNLPKGSS